MSKKKQPKKEQTLSDSELVKYLKGFKKINLKHKKINVNSLIKIVDIIKSEDYTVTSLYEPKLDDDGNKIIKGSTKMCSSFDEYKCNQKLVKLFMRSNVSYITYDKRVVKKGLRWVGYFDEYEQHVTGETKTTKVVLSETVVEVTITYRDNSEDISFYQDWGGEIEAIEFIERVKNHIMGRLDEHKNIKSYNKKITALNKVLKTL